MARTHENRTCDNRRQGVRQLYDNVRMSREIGAHYGRRELTKIVNSIKFSEALPDNMRDMPICIRLHTIYSDLSSIFR